VSANCAVDAVCIAPSQLIQNQIVFESEHLLLVVAKAISEQVGPMQQPQPGNFLKQVGATAEFIQVKMKLIVPFQEFAVIVLATPRSVEQIFEFGDVLSRDHFNRKAGGKSLEQRAHLGQVNDFGAGIAANGGATIGDQLDEAFGVQLVDRIPDRHPADAEEFGYCLRPQLGARRHVTADDGIANMQVGEALGRNILGHRIPSAGLQYKRFPEAQIVDFCIQFRQT
jgi:hypothetical protein